MDYIETPKARHFTIPLAVAAALFVWAWSDTTPNGWTLLLWALGGVMSFWFLMNCIHWVTMIREDYVIRKKEIEFKSHPNYLVEVLARMTDYQVRALRAGRSVIEIVPTVNGPIEVIGGTNCTRYAAWYILIRSNERSVFPINQFMKGTFHLDVWGDHSFDDQTQAQEFHKYLYSKGWGMWGRGNSSMTWTEGWSKELVMQQLGLEEDTYA